MGHLDWNGVGRGLGHEFIEKGTPGWDSGGGRPSPEPIHICISVLSLNSPQLPCLSESPFPARS